MKISDEDIKSYQLGDYRLIQYLIPRTDVISNVRQTVGRITEQILGVKGLTTCKSIQNHRNYQFELSLMKSHDKNKQSSSAWENISDEDYVFFFWKESDPSLIMGSLTPNIEKCFIIEQEF